MGFAHYDKEMSSFTGQNRSKLSPKLKIRNDWIAEKVCLIHVKSGTAKEIVWFNEKLFTVEMAHNRRNDYVMGKNSSLPQRVCHIMKSASA